MDVEGQAQLKNLAEEQGKENFLVMLGASDIRDMGAAS